MLYWPGASVVHADVHEEDAFVEALEKAIQLALHSEGYSGSDISIVVRDALFQPIRQLQTTTHFKPTQTAEGTKWLACAPSDEGAVERDIMSFEGSEVNVPPVSAENFFRALDRVKPSVSKEDAEALANWQYGDGE
ncbi:Vps4 C terminal oligomerization domain [Carpediemonas membranifera]|uniref:Vps4 C terminal oligomerization domain n=1 Tax=Carpediemonas membranifera TaxID=201153 RepID=A0A8J6BFJ8_9EUKA|nr:Vps4 C terminal oligomerization domain [Carpediemonas membranifera]QNO39409.1 vacuolar protein sorting 4C [Carpediemonas membranifera]|eukprot:KAG9396417.1 Vps4 C terminal oligomerization domain [Carpediemonas membranifera]